MCWVCQTTVRTRVPWPWPQTPGTVSLTASRKISHSSPMYHLSARYFYFIWFSVVPCRTLHISWDIKLIGGSFATTFYGMRLNWAWNLRMKMHILKITHCTWLNLYANHVRRVDMKTWHYWHGQTWPMSTCHQCDTLVTSHTSHEPVLHFLTYWWWIFRVLH